MEMKRKGKIDHGSLKFPITTNLCKFNYDLCVV